MKRRETFTFILAGLIWIIGNVVIFQITQVRLPARINEIWTQAIISDANGRLAETGKRYIRKYDKNETSPKVTIETENEKVYIDSKTLPHPQNEIERENRALQTVLLYFNPINTNRLDSVFRTSLKIAHIPATTGTSYLLNKPNNQTIFSSDDMTFYKEAFATDTIKTGIDESIILNGYVKLSWINNLYYALPLYSTWFLAGFICIIIYIYYRKKTTKNYKINIDPQGNNIQPKETVASPICNIIIYKTEHRDLVYGDIAVSLTPLQGSLLNCLLDGKNYYQNYSTLIDTLWPNENGEKKKLEQQRYILEERLEAIPAIHIKTIPRSGYQLELDEGFIIQREE